MLEQMIHRHRQNSFYLQEGRKVIELAIIADRAFMAT